MDRLHPDPSRPDPSRPDLSRPDLSRPDLSRARLGVLLPWFMLTWFMLLGGCQLIPLPMGRLHGTPATTDSFAFATAFEILQLETRPENPYTVNLRVTVIDGKLLVDAGNRKWHEYLRKDPRVRVRLGDRIYPARAVEVTDARIRSHFLSGRTVYQLVPVRPEP